METKTCATCEVAKPITDFPKNGKCPRGIQMWRPSCKNCYANLQRERALPHLKTKPLVNPRGTSSLPYRTCTVCLCVFPTEVFYTSGFRDGKLRRVSRCPECQAVKDAAHYRGNVDLKRGRDYRRRHGISLETYERLLRSQNFRCAICGIHESDVAKRFCVDHDHDCCPGNEGSCGRCVRGLLCGPCNRGIGQFYDSHEALLDAYNYVASKPRPLKRLEVM